MPRITPFAKKEAYEFRIPLINDEALDQLPRCKCCQLSIYPEKFKFSDSVDEFAKVAPSVSHFFLFLRFLGWLISRVLAV
jgi:hypothetical protein